MYLNKDRMQDYLAHLAKLSNFVILKFFCFVFFVVQVLQGGAQVVWMDFSAGPQTSPTSPLWSPQPALCTLLLTWHKLGGKP